MTIKPRQPVPALEFDTVGGARWTLAEQRPRNFSMIVVYRGLHCPVCNRYTSELNNMIGEFEKRGVTTVVTSTDTKERAEQAKSQWALSNLTVGYGVSIEKAREWSLYISTGFEGQPPLFAEPGLFLVRPDGTLFLATISNMPFARPPWNEVAQGIDYFLSKNLPARGEA